jgi:hypothetical protein
VLEKCILCLYYLFFNATLSFLSFTLTEKRFSYLICTTLIPITLRKCIGNSTKVIDLVEQDDEDIFNVHMEKLIRAVAAASMTPRGY